MSISHGSVHGAVFAVDSLPPFDRSCCWWSVVGGRWSSHFVSDILPSREWMHTPHHTTHPPHTQAIYPIKYHDTLKEYTIRGLELPADLYSMDDERISSALGYTAHLVCMLAKYLQIPLRYQVIYNASRCDVVPLQGAARGARWVSFVSIAWWWNIVLEAFAGQAPISYRRIRCVVTLCRAVFCTVRRGEGRGCYVSLLIRFGRWRYTGK